MVKKRLIDIAGLEILIDERIDRYEDEIEQYWKTEQSLMALAPKTDVACN
jgi:hypothetical protein